MVHGFMVLNIFEGLCSALMVNMSGIRGKFLVLSGLTYNFKSCNVRNQVSKHVRSMPDL